MVPDKPDISIVVPVFKAGESLPELVHGIKESLNSRGQSWELILVDDNSPDISWEVIKELVGKNRGIVRGLRLTRRFGQHNATLCGMNYARGQLVVTMDDDLEHDPRYIERLVDKQKQTGADIVIANLVNKHHSVTKQLFSYLNRRLSQFILKYPSDIVLSSFRVFKREVVVSVLSSRTAMPYFPALMFSRTHKVLNVEIPHRQRFSGESGYKLMDTIRLGSRLIFNHSSILLDLIGVLGFVAAIFSCVMIAAIVIKKMFFSISITGWASVTVSVLFFGGLILLSLGIIGKYLVRILNELSYQPQFFVSEEAN